MPSDVEVPISEKLAVAYFEDREQSAAFAKAFIQLLGATQKKLVSRYLSQDNVQRIRHRGPWKHPGLPHASNNEVKQHSSEFNVPYDNLMQNDLSSINLCVNKIAADMERQFTELMYSTISETCERSGNVIEAKSTGSISEAFAQMLEQIQFSVDVEGNVRLPEIHMAPGQIDALEKAIQAEPPEYQDRIEQIKTRKTREALERESARKAKFLKYGDDQ